MSEHRLRETRDSKRRRLMRLLEEPHCKRWPDCNCNQSLLFYEEKLATGADAEWSVAELAAAETKIFFSLCCMRDCSPDPAQRRYATIQLLNPWWDRQRRGEEITEEFIRNG